MSAFIQALVMDVILDPASIKPDQQDVLNRIIENIGDTAIPKAHNLPRNCLVYRSVHASDGHLQSSSQLKIALPFHSPHFCPPIKPGELVWIFLYDQDQAHGQSGPNVSGLRASATPETSTMPLVQATTQARTGFKMPRMGYWMGRVTTFMQYEDINYVPPYRSRLMTVVNNDEVEYADGEKESPPKGEYARTAEDNLPSMFSNGDPGIVNRRAILPTSTMETIYNDATAHGIFQFEPVPRFTCRPGSMVLQGSNNTLISMDVDRCGPIAIMNEDESGMPFPIASGSTDSHPKTDFFSMAGTIDMVCGRGRVLPDPGKDPERTAVGVIETDAKRGDVATTEADTNPEASDKAPNLEEGNPDFLMDSSRIYVSMRTNGDKNFFHVDDDKNPMFEDMKTSNSPEDYFDGDTLISVPEDATGAAYIVAKSDEIRIVARKNDDLIINPESKTKVNGSIRIVKEGDAGKDLAAIIMHPDGTVQIDAPRIILGRNDAGPFDDGCDPGVDDITGYVKFSQYNVQMSALHDEVAKLASAVQKIASGVENALKVIEGGFKGAVGMIPIGALQGIGNAGVLTDLISGIDVKGMSISGYEIAEEVEGAVGGDTNGSGAAKGDDLKSKIPEARSETIFGE